MVCPGPSKRHFAEGKTGQAAFLPLQGLRYFLEFVKKVNNVYHVSLYVPTSPCPPPKDPAVHCYHEVLQRRDLLVYVIYKIRGTKSWCVNSERLTKPL